MVDFNMDMHVGGDAKPPFYSIKLKDDGGLYSRAFVVTKKADIVRSATSGLIDVVGFWVEETNADESTDIYDLSGREICSVIIPVNNIDYIENLMYRPR
jgi:hypothetical protein